MANSGAGSTDVYLFHPELEPQTIYRLAGHMWPDGDLQHLPSGYGEISSRFFGLRAFCRSEAAGAVRQASAELPARVRDWIDAVGRTWTFDEIFKARELNFWVFFRASLVSWLSELMAEREVLAALAGDGRLAITAAGIDRYRRRMLRDLSESTHGRVRAEVAFVDPPRASVGETATERRLRRLFFLLQDAWHGVQFLYEDLLVRRPKVLIVSDGRCLQRRALVDGARSDIYFETIWRQGRQRPWRLYYRTDSYHPDVGALTGSRLAPTYLRHALFLLGQTSRGFLETRSIVRQWSRLKQSEEFRHALNFEGVPVASYVVEWIDEALERRLPWHVRDTRRETHFLRGTRPDALLITREQETNRALLLAAHQLGIPTVAVQFRPLHDRDHAYLLAQQPLDRRGWLADRLCVFSQDAKRFLVETGNIDPSMIVVSGDPRSAEPNGMNRLSDRASPVESDGDAAAAVARLRKLWGVEGGRKVVAVASPPRHCPELLRLVADAARRDDLFILLKPLPARESFEALRWLTSIEELSWVHVDNRSDYVDWILGVDCLVTTCRTQMAEALLRRRRVALVELGVGPRFGELDPGDLVRSVKTATELEEVLNEFVDRQPGPLPADDRWREFVDRTFGRSPVDAANHVLDTVGEMLTRV